MPVLYSHQSLLHQCTIDRILVVYFSITILQNWPLIIDTKDGTNKIMLVFIDKYLYLRLQFKLLHLLTYVEQIILDILEHTHLRYY